VAQFTIIPSPTIALCDALVTFGRAQWEPKAPSGIERSHRGQTIKLDESKGRQVRIVPLGYDSIAAARGLDFYNHRIGVLTFERYEDAADPEEVIPIAWIDERVDFVHTLRDAFDFYRDGTQPSFNKQLQTITAPVEDIYDPDLLAQDKVFWSWIEFGFQEVETI
jgi:hypothetical protein